MRAALLASVAIGVLATFVASGSQASAQTYAEGFADGRAVGYQEGLAARPPTGGSTQSIGGQTIVWQGSGASGGSSQMLPNYWLIATEGLQLQSGTELAGGAVTFQGEELNSPEVWESVLNQTSIKLGIAKDKLQLYAIPVDELVDGSDKVTGLVYNADASGIAKSFDFGSSAKALEKFGSVPIVPDGGFVMVEGY